MEVDKSKDYINQISIYIKKNLAKGYTIDALKISLMNQGYSRIAINNAINQVNEEMASIVPKMVEKPIISYKISPNLVEMDREDGFFSRLFKNFFGR